METKQLALLRNECWWGGIVADGVHMPYDEKTCIHRDLRTDQFMNQSMPLLVSSHGRSLWSDQPFAYAFEKGVLRIGTPGRLFFADRETTLAGAFSTASNCFFPSGGRAPDSAMFAAPQYCTWIETLYHPTEANVLEYARGILEAGYPPGVLIVDDCWQEDYGNWVFHTGRFQNPRGLVNALHEMGFKVMLWVCNFVSADSLACRELEKAGWLVKNGTGGTAIAKWWNGYSAMLDISQREAVRWFTGQLDALREQYGIDGFKFDAGDLAQFEQGFQCAGGYSATEYCKAWGEIGLRYSFNEYRAAYGMGGQPLAQRLRDKLHSWDAGNGLKSLIPDALAQGLMGYGYGCPDMIGGGEYLDFGANRHSLDYELIVRSAQCAALFPMMQFSAAVWKFLPKRERACCFGAVKIREKHKETILRLVQQAVRTGEPILRHMEYAFPHAGYTHICDQFMVGDALLAAPVLEKGATSRVVEIPPGEWRGWNNNRYKGPSSVIVDAPLEELPHFVKEV